VADLVGILTKYPTMFGARGLLGTLVAAMLMPCSKGEYQLFGTKEIEGFEPSADL
jgi:hypothetical protein